MATNACVLRVDLHCQRVGEIYGDQCLEHFCSKGRTSYIVGKSEKSLDKAEPTFHAEKTACY